MSLANSAHRTPVDRVPGRETARPRPHALENLVVLSRDRTLLQTVRAVCPGGNLSAVASEVDLANHLAAGGVGVAILDASAVASAVTALTQSLASQFPDLALIVAGDAEAQSALAGQVTDGTVHRFLHKPVSEQRVKAFIDAAWRRHEHEQANPPPPPAEPVIVVPRRPLPIRQILRVGGIVAAAVALLAGIRFVMTLDLPAIWQMRAPAPQAVEAAYRPAAATPIEADSHSAELDRLLAEAEAALVAERMDEAERLAAAARELDPNHAQVAFLTTQIGKERERALLTRAREAAAKGDLAGAIGLLEGAAGADGSTLVAETRRELEQRHIEEQVADFLRRAEARAAAGALLEPAQDNAGFLIRSAQALAPDAENVRAAQSAFAARLLETARTSLGAGELAAADRWLEAAGEAGADAARSAELRRDLQRARSAARAASFARALGNFNARLEQDRVLEPAADSAKHWLAQLASLDAEHDSTRGARQSFIARALAEATAATAKGDFQAGERWLAEAVAAGAPDAEAAAIAQQIERRRRESAVVDAGTLERLRYTAPRYPDAALAKGRDGWVELEFTVGTTGTVGAIAVVRSEPAGVFDAAAVNALRKWRYRPVMSDGVAVEQRARVRMRFTLE